MLQKDLPIYGEYDVIVAGGGTSGFAAGVAAARNGAKTLVVEKNPSLGGTSTGGMVSMFAGFSLQKEKATGIIGEVLDRLAKYHGTTGLYTMQSGRHRFKVAGYDYIALKQVLDELTIESGAEVLLHTGVIDICKEGQTITGLVIHNTEGIQVVKGKVIIDASFHGEIACKAGCRWELGRPGDGVLQPGSLIFRMANVDYKKFNQLTREQKNALANQGIQEGRHFIETIICRPVHLPEPELCQDDYLFHCNNSRVTVNPLDAKSLTKAEMEARRQVKKIVAFFQEEVPGFAKAYLVTTGEYVGLRDSRRIMGKYVLAQEDVLRGERFPDAVAECSWPIDIHQTGGPGHVYVKPENEVYYIPYRCMVNDAINNLIVTGRCISTTYEAHAGIRVMAQVMALGEAAGTAAAECVKLKRDANEYDGSLISKRLLG